MRRILKEHPLSSVCILILASLIPTANSAAKIKQFWSSNKWIVASQSHTSSCSAKQKTKSGNRIAITLNRSGYSLEFFSDTMRNTSERTLIAPISIDQSRVSLPAKISANGLHGKISVTPLNNQVIPALQAGNKIRVSLPGEKVFNYSLAGSSAAIKKLNECYTSVFSDQTRETVSAAKIPNAGLFYPSGDNIEWACLSELLGQYGGALGVKNNILYGTEWTCKLVEPTNTNFGTQFVGICEAEGSQYRDLITLKETQAGLTVRNEDGVFEWLKCPSKTKRSVSSSDKRNVNNETKLTNEYGDGITFVWGLADQPSQSSIKLGYKESFSGKVSLVLDGEGYDFKATNNTITINSECQACRETFNRLATHFASGRSLVVVPNGRKPVTFVTGGKSNKSANIFGTNYGEFSEKIMICSRAGCTASVLEKRDFGTQYPRLRAQVKESDARDFCVSYSYPNWLELKQKDKVDQCIANQLKDGGGKPFWISADCRRATVTNGVGITYQKNGYDDFGNNRWKNISNPFPNERIPFEVNDSYWNLLCNG